MKKKPEVGQWWVNVVDDPPRVYKTGIVLFVGRDSNGRLLWEECQGHIETDYGCDWSDWHHEPACTGWDWVPETSPQWYSYKTGLFESNNDPYLIRVDSDVKQAFVHRSGKIDNITCPYKLQELIDNVRSGAWKKLSKQEADEVLHPKEPAATVTVYEVVYGDTAEKLDHDTLVGDECLNRYKRRYKYVSVVSTKTVEVML